MQFYYLNSDLEIQHNNLIVQRDTQRQHMLYVRIAIERIQDLLNILPEEAQLYPIYVNALNYFTNMYNEMENDLQEIERMIDHFPN